MTRLLRTQWDGLAALVAAVALTILSVLDVLPSDQVPAATLGVLALVCFTLIRDGADWKTSSRAMEALDTSTRESTSRIVELVVEGDNRLGSSIATLSTKVQLAGQIHGVAPRAIGPSYIDVLSRTKIWMFKGGTGTYLRAETLPRLALSKAPGLRKAWIEIINPGSLTVCRAYSGYRKQMMGQHSTNDREDWSLRRVRIECYATVIAALWFRSHHSNIAIYLGLSSTVSTFRYDMSSEFLMITNENKDSTALRVDADTSFFRRYRDELNLSFQQAQEVDLTGVTIARHFTGDDVRRALAEMHGMRTAGPFLTDSVCSEIAAKAISEPHAVALGQARGDARNPYA